MALLPGSTGRRSSSSTIVDSLTVNRTGSPFSAPGIELLLPATPVSVDPYPSTTITFGSAARIRSLAAGESIAPPEASTMSDDRSYGSSAAVTASISGRAMASPTTVMTFVFVRAAICSTSTGSNDPGRGITTVPPPKSAMNAAQCALTCMRGGVTSCTAPNSGMRLTIWSGAEIGPSKVVGSPPPIDAKKMSSWRHITPLGMPVVPPVYAMYTSSALRSSKSRAGEAAASAASYSTAPAGTSASVPSPTTTRCRSCSALGATAATTGPNCRWKTSATRSALSKRYSSSRST